MEKKKEVFTQAELKDILGRYHFGDTGFSCMEKVYEAAVSFAEPQVCFHIGDRDAAAAVTLGAGADRLQDLYFEQGLVLEVYMLECIAMEWMRKLYREMISTVQQTSGKWVCSLEFPGESLPLQRIPELLERSGSTAVRCSSVYALRPKYSAVLQMKLEGSRPGRDVSLCAACKNKSCVYRQGISTKKERG